MTRASNTVVNRPLQSLLSLSVAICLAMHPAAAFGKAASEPLSQATLLSQGRSINMSESRLDGQTTERYFSEGGTSLYRTRIRQSASGFEVDVLEGHPSQRGRFSVEGGRLAVFDAAGAPLWNEPLRERLCLPELLGEFVRAHWELLALGAQPLRCVTPIIKAKKVAPLQLRRMPDSADGERVVEVSAGSLGMRFFVVPTRLTFSPDGSRLNAQSGQFEAPRSIDGSASYLRGQATYTRSRPIPVWPISAFAPAAPAKAEVR